MSIAEDGPMTDLSIFGPKLSGTEIDGDRNDGTRKWALVNVYFYNVWNIRKFDDIKAFLICNVVCG